MRTPKSLSYLSILSAGALLCLAVAPNARADKWNQKTVFTFNGPIEIPGRVLPPGTYTFKLANSMTDRDIVEVFNKNESHMFGMFLTIPDYHLKPASRTIVTFEERAAGSPEAVRAWFYPGDNYGHEFVYPKFQAAALAKANHTAVPSLPNEMAAKNNETATNSTQPANTVNESNATALRSAPLTAEQPDQGEVQVAQAFPPARPAPATSNPPAELPKTAGSFALVGLLGLLSLGAAGSLRWILGKIEV